MNLCLTLSAFLFLAMMVLVSAQGRFFFQVVYQVFLCLFHTSVVWLKATFETSTSNTLHVNNILDTASSV